MPSGRAVVAAGSTQPGRRALRLVISGAALLTLLLVAAGWYFASQLTAPPTVRPFDPDNEVLAATDDEVTLRAEGWAATDGTWGLQLPQGRHVVLEGPPTSSGDEVTWGWRDLVGERPPTGADDARVDEFVWVGTPEAVGLPFEEVEVDGPLGPLPSWWVPADGDARGTVVFVHGRGGTREEALRFLPTMVGAGWNVLVQTYRGDVGAGAPPLPDDTLRYGVTEWEDVDAAIDTAVDRAPGPVVLFGASMGGALVAQYLDNAGPEPVVGVVLDSPLLSMDALLDLQANLNGVPEVLEPVLLPVVKAVARLRYGLDSGALEQVADDGTFDVPVLLFHGAADDFVPVEPSLELARLDQVTYVPIDGAGHVRSWNVDRDRYEAALRSFLDGLPT